MKIVTLQVVLKFRDDRDQLPAYAVRDIAASAVQRQFDDVDDVSVELIPNDLGDWIHKEVA